MMHIYRAGMLLVGLSFGVAKADGIDQSNTNFFPSLYQNIQVFSPIGQSFTPHESALNFVELFTEDFSAGQNGSATLEVEVHSGAIDGPVLGTSLPTTLLAGFTGPTAFDFLSPVPLVPEAPFVIDVIQVSGHEVGLGSSGGPNSTYPSGDEILVGIPQPNNDLWFAEGIVPMPEPSILQQLLVLLAGLILLTRRSIRFPARGRPAGFQAAARTEGHD